MSANSAALLRAKRPKSRVLRETHVVALTDGPPDILPLKPSPVDKSSPLPVSAIPSNQAPPSNIMPIKTPFAPNSKSTLSPTTSSGPQSDLERLKKLKEEILMGQHPHYNARPRPDALEALSLVYNPPQKEEDVLRVAPQLVLSHSREPPLVPLLPRPQPNDSASRQIPRSNDFENFDQSQASVPPARQFPAYVPPRLPHPGTSDGRHWEPALRDNRPHTPIVSSSQNGGASLPTPQSIPSSAQQDPNRAGGDSAGIRSSDQSAGRRSSYSGSGGRDDLRMSDNDNNTYRTMTPTPVAQGSTANFPPHRVPPRPNPQGVSGPSQPTPNQRDTTSKSSIADDVALSRNPPILLKRSEVQAMEKLALQEKSRHPSQDQQIYRSRESGSGASIPDRMEETRDRRDIPRSYALTHDVYFPPDSPPDERVSTKPPSLEPEGRYPRSLEPRRIYDRPADVSEHIDQYRPESGSARDVRRQDNFERHPEEFRGERLSSHEDNRSVRQSDLPKARSDGQTYVPPLDKASIVPSRVEEKKVADARVLHAVPSLPPPPATVLPASAYESSSGKPSGPRESQPQRLRDARPTSPPPYRSSRDNYPPASSTRDPVANDQSRRDSYPPPPPTLRAPSPSRSVRRESDYQPAPFSTYYAPGESREWRPREDRDRPPPIQSSTTARPMWENDGDRGRSSTRDPNYRSYSRDRPDSPKYQRDMYDARAGVHPPPRSASGAWTRPISPPPPPSVIRHKGPDHYSPPRDGEQRYPIGSYGGASPRFTTYDRALSPSSRVRARSPSPGPYGRPSYTGGKSSVPDSDAARSAKRARVDEAYDGSSYRTSTYPYDAHAEDRRGPPSDPPPRRGTYERPGGDGSALPLPPPLPPSRDSTYIQPRPRSPLGSSYRPRDSTGYPSRLNSPPRYSWDRYPPRAF